MGLRDYFRNRPAQQDGGNSSGTKVEKVGKKKLPTALPPPPPPPTIIDPASGINSAAGSSNSSGSLDDIKHEVVVNYLFQQQSAMMWGNPAERNSYYGAPYTGVEEGVLLRKRKGNYIACPLELAQGEFAKACTALNVHV